MIIAVKVLTVVNLMLCLRLYLIKRKVGSPFQFFYLTLMAVVTFPELMTRVDELVDFHVYGTIFYFSIYDFALSQLITFGFLFCFMVLEHTIPTVDLTMARKRGGLPNLFYFLPFAAFCLYLIYFVMTFGLERLAISTFLELRDTEISSHYLRLSYLSIFSVFLPHYLYYDQNRRLPALLILALFTLYFAVLGGSRQTLTVAMLLMIYSALERRKYAAFLWVLVFTVGFVAVDTLLMVFKFIRNTQGFEARVMAIQELVTGKATLNNTSGEGSILHVYHMFVAIDWERPFGSGTYLLRALTFWLPSSLDVFGIKPSDFEAEMFTVAMSGREGTMHATYFGSAFADLGYFFPFWCMFTVLVFRVLEYFMQQSAYPNFLFSLGVYLSVMSARGALYAVLVVVFLGCALEIVANANLGLKRKGSVQTRAAQRTPERTS